MTAPQVRQGRVPDQVELVLVPLRALQADPVLVTTPAVVICKQDVVLEALMPTNVTVPVVLILLLDAAPRFVKAFAAVVAPVPPREIGTTVLLEAKTVRTDHDEATGSK